MQTADWQLLFSDRFTGARNPARLPTLDAIPSNPLRPPFNLSLPPGQNRAQASSPAGSRAPRAGRPPKAERISCPFPIPTKPAHPLVNRVLGLGRQRVEGVAIDHVAARIPQESLFADPGPADSGPCCHAAALGKNLRKPSPELPRQRRLIHETAGSRQTPAPRPPGCPHPRECPTRS